MDVSIIIVNYNTFEITCNCIDSIYKETNNLKIEIILIDNASKECSPELFLNKFPLIRLIKNEVNEGFGRANNQGMEIAHGQYLLLLNSDTIIIENTIEKNYNFLHLNKNEKIGVIGCRQINEKGKELLSHNNKSKYSFWSDQFLANPLFSILFDTRSNFSEIKTRKVTIVSGAFILLKREVFNNIGGFDPDFFLYYEEIEWFYRVNKKYEIYFFADSVVKHLLSSSSNKIKNSTLLLQKQFSKSLYYSKMGSVYYFIYVLFFYFNSCTKLLLLFIRLKWKTFHEVLKLSIDLTPYLLYVIPWKYSEIKNNNNILNIG